MTSVRGSWYGTFASLDEGEYRKATMSEPQRPHPVPRSFVPLTTPPHGSAPVPYHLRATFLKGALEYPHGELTCADSWSLMHSFRQMLLKGR